jgi:hypothetical protein
MCGYIKRYDNKIFFTPLFCCCFWNRDPGWEKSGSEIRDKHPGSATLRFVLRFLLYSRAFDIRRARS